MSTYVLMRILESAPRRYEIGIRLLTLGQIEKAYDRLASHIEHGQHVLDLGCGTGALALRAARQGAKVKGIDVNAQMLEIAGQRVQEAGLTEAVDLMEIGVAELNKEETESYDTVTSGLCFSELSEDELIYTLKHIARILKPGGLLLVADEVKPQTLFRRLVHSLITAPLVILTYVITQQTTHPTMNLSDKLMDGGLSIVSVNSDILRSFSEFVARKPAGASR
ncbi:MAG: corrinoid protein-associated methyltransferase CpaM [Candidatus Binatia bacterium]